MQSRHSEWVAATGVVLCVGVGDDLDYSLTAVVAFRCQQTALMRLRLYKVLRRDGLTLLTRWAVLSIPSGRLSGSMFYSHPKRRYGRSGYATPKRLIR